MSSNDTPGSEQGRPGIHPDPDLTTGTAFSSPRGDPAPAGVDALRQLLRNVPQNCGLAIILVPQFDPQHESLVAEILASHSALPVEIVGPGMTIQPNHVYVIPPDATAELQRELGELPEEPRAGNEASNIRALTPGNNAAKELAESEERFRVVVESVRDYAIFQLDEAGKVITWNTGAERLLGWQEDEILGKSGFVIFTPEDLADGEAERELETARSVGRAEDQRWHVKKDGSRFFASGVLTRAAGRAGDPVTFTKVMQDITARKEQEDLLRRSLEEKGMLVREIHHRVKNNLQMIVSLMNLQARHTRDPRVLSAFEDTQGRLRAIAHIHEQLYASDDLSDVEVGGYVSALARDLVAMNATTPGRVTLELKTERLVLDIEKAVPLALIANELILNSLKHGLTSGPGSLTVTLTRTGSSPAGATLSVEDTGPGLPVDFDPENARSMGFRLMNLLVQQLKGRMIIANGPGARIEVAFPLAGE